jgi:sugar phosphate isomerase/epimerase
MGADGVGIWRAKVNEVGAQEAADFLFEMKLPVSSVHWAGGFTGSEGLSYVEAVNDAIDSVKLAGMLGAETLVIQPGARNGHTCRHATRLLETALNSIAPVAADYGVRLALEPMQFGLKCPFTFLRGIEQALEVAAAYSPSDVGLVLDLFHIGTQYYALERLEEFADRIQLVQLGDRRITGGYSEKRCQLGQGVLPIADWLQRLDEVGYEGFYEIETWGVTNQAEQYRDIIEGELQFARGQLAAVTSNSSSTFKP